MIIRSHKCLDLLDSSQQDEISCQDTNVISTQSRILITVFIIVFNNEYIIVFNIVFRLHWFRASGPLISIQALRFINLPSLPKMRQL